MKFTATAAALVASAGLVAAVPGNGWGHGHLTSSCWTSSTCKATSYPVTVPYTTTIWKPETTHSESQSVYTKTETITSYVVKTKTWVETKTVPSSYVTSKTVCHTYPVTISTSSESVCTETKTWSYPTSSLSYCPETTEVWVPYTTSTPCPEVTSSVTYKPSSECNTWTGWKTWTAGGW